MNICLCLSISVLLLATPVLRAQLPANWPADYPAWWYDADPDKSMVDVSSLDDPGNQSPILQGQLLHMASIGIKELNEHLASVGGAGFTIDDFKDSGKEPSYYSPAAIGQLKFVASKFYDRFAEIGYQPGSNGWNPSIILDEGVGDNSLLYPWKVDKTPENMSVALIGQAKFLFSWDFAQWLVVDSDINLDGSTGDNLPDWWEHFYISYAQHDADPSNDFVNSLGVFDPNADYDDDSLNNLREYQEGTNPFSKDTDGDKMSDPYEVFYQLAPRSSARVTASKVGPDDDLDGDTLTNLEESLMSTNPRANTYQAPTGDWIDQLPNGIYWEFDLVNQSVSASAVVAEGYLFVLEHTPSLVAPFHAEDYIVGDDKLHEDYTVFPSDWGSLFNFFRFTITSIDADYDGDGIPSSIELVNGTSPIVVDAIVDSDIDELPDWWEQYWFEGELRYDADADVDGDNLSNAQEFAQGLDPTSSISSDGDSLPDDWEQFYSLADEAVDEEPDGFTNQIEFLIRSNPSLGYTSDSQMEIFTP